MFTGNKLAQITVTFFHKIISFDQLYHDLDIAY